MKRVLCVFVLLLVAVGAFADPIADAIYAKIMQMVVELGYVEGQLAYVMIPPVDPPEVAMQYIKWAAESLRVFLESLEEWLINMQNQVK